MDSFKNGLKCVVAVALAVGLAMPDEASADRDRRWHGGASVGLYVGTPLYWGWPGPYYPYPPAYYPYPPYYAYPPTVVVPSEPPVYIERNRDEASSSREDGYWYYCDRPSGYYPDVKECPDGWQRVAPRRSR